MIVTIFSLLSDNKRQCVAANKLFMFVYCSVICVSGQCYDTFIDWASFISFVRSYEIESGANFDINDYFLEYW